MITTPEIILRDVSYQMGEEVFDTSSVRISYFNRAYQYYLSLNKWSFKIKDYSLTTTTNTEYDLTSLISDYSQSDGLYEVRNSGGELVEFINYVDKDLPSSTNKNHYYITPDGKKIGFTSHTAGDVYNLKYYAVLTPVSSYNETLNIPIPEHHAQPITTYIMFLIHNRKRQRNDARNCILDFKEQLEETLMKDANYKNASFVPKTFTPVRKMLGI